MLQGKFAREYASGFFQDIRERYIPKIKAAVNRDGELIVGCPAEYVFDVLRRDGTVLRVRRDDWEPVAISSEEADNYVDGWTRQLRDLGGAHELRLDDTHPRP